MDEKIQSFKGESYEELVNILTVGEIKEMKEYLECEYGYDYDWEDDKEERDRLVISDYIKEWLIESIREGTHPGTKRLFDIVYNILD